MSMRQRLKNNIVTVLVRNKEGSFATQSARRHTLLQAGEWMISQGYKINQPEQVKQKHINALVQFWQKEELSAGTIKNRLSHLRWLFEKTGRANVVPSNDDLHVAKRMYVANENKAADIRNLNVNAMTDKHVIVQLHLQRYLGLRREESIKLKPHVADKGEYLYLQGSWCKGGRERAVPIDTPEARYWLEEAKALAPNVHQSLIPLGRNYRQHRDIYDKQVQKSGIRRAHGLRHAYAQELYQKITGWPAPVCGGPTRKQLTPEQRTQDKVARLVVSEQLGHSRESITRNYLGV